MQRPAWWRPGEAIDRPLTHEELAIIKTPCAAPAAAPGEDGPSSSASKRRKIHVDPIARDWFLDILDQWKTERRWDMPLCLCEVQRLCPGVFDGIDPNTRYRWKRSAPRAETRGRKSLLSSADMTRLSEHIMRVTDVLCLSAVTIRGLVHGWLDSEELDARPSKSWVKRLLRGMSLSFKKPAKCLKVQIVHAGKTDAVLPEQPWPERTHHVTSENGWATTTTILQLAATLDDVMNPSKEGQAWILLWDMAGNTSIRRFQLCLLSPKRHSVTSGDESRHRQNRVSNVHNFKRHFCWSYDWRNLH